MTTLIKCLAYFPLVTLEGKYSKYFDGIMGYFKSLGYEGGYEMLEVEKV